MNEHAFPPALADLAKYGSSSHPEFQMYEEFEAPEETAWWFRLWTGNDEVDGREFRFFCMEGAGGYTGLWLTREGRPLEAQPVVYLGSEGEIAVMASDVGSFLWLLAQGWGPHEVTEEREPGPVDPDLVRIAERNAPGGRREPAAIVRQAREEFPHFTEVIGAMCR
ncbi:hypothetical protein F4561_000642 [Lipingzhangella halophila]|uniref:SMI1/KNR4 family protein n=1 Tax=Lipingzhangella halophila TaxID=1783352 RepID=A0A7W7RD57_9ACTN|nr:SMI1/KNR4 family protein [Lipingzhangella halophila]MBB4929822.1 hypothetical protein [Lipingzhangella halophila]